MMFVIFLATFGNFCLRIDYTKYDFFICLLLFTKGRIIDGGLDPGMGKWLISAIGVSNTVGRALCGVVSSLPNVSAMLVNNVMLTVGGIATILSGLYMTVAYQFAYAIVFGFSVCEFNYAMSTLIAHIKSNC